MERKPDCEQANSAVHHSHSRNHLALLQVAARTGEVSPYLSSHRDEDSAPAPKEQHQGINGIANLLSHGAASSGHGNNDNDNNDDVIEEKRASQDSSEGAKE